MNAKARPARYGQDINPRSYALCKSDKLATRSPRPQRLSKTTYSRMTSTPLDAARTLGAFKPLVVGANRP
jgi:hypothetical protein